MTINQRLIFYRRIKKVFENRIMGIYDHKFKVNQHLILKYNIHCCGICFCVQKLSNYEVEIYSKKSLKFITPEIYQTGLREGYDMDVSNGYWFPAYPNTKEGLAERVKFLEKVIKYTKECIKKQQEI